MDLKVKKISNLNLKDNEIYLLCDFNINFFQNGTYIKNEKRSNTSQGSVHTLIKGILSNLLFEAINTILYMCNILISY